LRLRRESERLQKELERYRVLRVETALDRDISWMFSKINDAEDPDMTIEDLLGLRDFIIEHSIEVSLGTVVDPESGEDKPAVSL